MHAVTAKLPDDLYERLENLGKMIDRKKSYLIRKAVEGFLEEREDYGSISIPRIKLLYGR